MPGVRKPSAFRLRPFRHGAAGSRTSGSTDARLPEVRHLAAPQAAVRTECRPILARKPRFPKGMIVHKPQMSAIVHNPRSLP